MQNFKELIVWQKSMYLVKEVYRHSKTLPLEEQYGLCSQMQRSAVSIPSNIAEGQRRSRKEFKHFLHIASGSAAELETQLLIVSDVYKVPADTTIALLKEIQMMLTALQKKLT